MVPQVLAGKYVIQEEIARGGMGVIHKAIDHTLKRVVAIKLVHAHLSGDPAFVERFLREARAMARLQHENIATIYAVEEDQKTQFLVMEFCPGRNLRDVIRNQPRLPLRDIASVSRQLASALAYAHAHGVIHRDIKPANVLLDKSGKAKLTDFGIAAALDEVSLTSAGQIVGTPEYMSPEQARGRKLDGRSDLYSLGIVMYEMLTGRTPYGDSSGTSILGKLAYDREELVLQFHSHVPSLVQSVVRDLLRRDPADRIPDAETLAGTLHEILYTLPQAPPPAQEETEPTIVSAPPPPRIDERTGSSSPLEETVVVGTTRTEPREQTPESLKSPQTLHKTTVLSGLRRESSSHKVPELSFPPQLPPVPVPTSSSTKPVIVGGILLVGTLAGLIWYLGPQTDGTIPSDKPPEDIDKSPIAHSPPPAQKVAQLVEELKILETTMHDSEQLLRTLSGQLEKEQRTANCLTLKRGLRETYGTYDNTLREVNRVYRELNRDPVPPITRPPQLDLDCEGLKPDPVSPKPQPPPEPLPAPPVHVAEAFPDGRLLSLVEQFKQAYEQHDLKTLRSLSRMDEARQRNVETMFGNYKTLKLSMASIRPEDGGATALMVIDTAITPSGETVALSPIAKNIKLHIPRQGEGWDKIAW